ncbi:NAD-dependent epimerase/dehydratase family protein [Desulfovibrio cuneatus]|uniref:NAD-dependent epimerase/dehydratase family protein n=1 Tax=Desulfovibrio cuneatus TaxID=159728 RepID=UPI000406B6EE|nr:NAD(P)-dependent oxidoreductase [Desulfovibrio cuneatus]
MNYLVTGGLGYVGSWAVRHLAQAGHTVFAMSRKAGKPDLGVPYTLVQADLAGQSPEEIAAVLPQGLHGIVHAASLNEAFLPGYPREALLANALGTRNVLEALVLAHKAQGAAPLPVVVYCSTFHVYGKSEGEITEFTPPDPKNDYALTHLFAEQYCRMFGHTAGMPCITVRLTNGYGAPVSPGFDKWHLIINDLCKQAVEQGSLTLNANPAIERDFLWLGDIARCFELLLPRRDLAGQTFVAAAQRTVSLGEVAELIASTAQQMLGTPVPIHYKTAPSPCPRLQVRATALHKATGFTPTGSMEQAIRAILALCNGK